MNYSIRAARVMALAMLAVCATVGTALAAPASLTIYTDNYAGDEAISRIARNVIEQHYHTQVHLKPVSVGVAFLGTAHNKNSVFLAAWLPKTHASYMARVKNQVDDLGTIYNGARLGWAVPSYVPAAKLDSIADLAKPAVAARLHHRIQGISAGSGLMQLSHKAVKAYGLNDIHLVTASGPAMTAALKRAIDAHRWIVVTAWSPHWMWQRFHLRYLKDPKGTLGSAEHVDAIVNPSLQKDAPRIAGFLSRMHFSLQQVNAMLDEANKTSYETAAKQFVRKNPQLVASWLGKDD